MGSASSLDICLGIIRYWLYPIMAVKPESVEVITTFRPLDLHESFLTIDWDHSQLIVRLVMVRTGSTFLRRWVDIILSSMWSNYLWLLWTPFLADRRLRLPYRKLWMVKRSGWWRKNWIVGWWTGNCVIWWNGRVLVLSTIPGNLGIMFMHQNWWQIFTRGTLVLLVTSVWSTSAPFLSIQCRVVTALKGGWTLGDAPLCPTFPPIFLCHSSSSLLAQDGVHLRLRYRSPMITWRSIPITVSPFSIFFIILLFRLWFLVYRHASYFSRALSFSFRIPC